jgi:Uncharacterized protein containing a NRPS condensation (elongation) domain
MPTVDKFSKKNSITAGDINIYYARGIADQQIIYVIEFSARVDVSRLNMAQTVLYNKIPILASLMRIRHGKLHRNWLPGIIPTTDIVNNIKDESEAIFRFVTTPTDPGRDLPLKVALIRGNQHDTLCIKMDHTLSDASGLKYLLYLLAEAYTKDGIELTVNWDRGIGSIIRQISPATLVKEFYRTKIPKPGPSIYTDIIDSESLFIERVILDSVKYGKLHTKAKQYEVTINDMILTALFRSIFQSFAVAAGISYPVMMPLDMRRYLPREKQGVVANLTSAVYPILVKSTDESFIDTLLRVKGQTNMIKNNNPGLGTVLWMMLGCMAGGYILKKRYEQALTGQRFINLTNFGTVDEKLLGFGGAEVKSVYGIGPRQYNSGILIAVSTFRENISFVVQGKDTQKFRPFVRSFLESMIYELESFLNSSSS